MDLQMKLEMRTQMSLKMKTVLKICVEMNQHSTPSGEQQKSTDMDIIGLQVESKATT